MDRIALMGHSRGGEAVAVAGAFNRMRYYPDDGTKEMPSGFGIRTIVAIAPVDGQYTPADRPTPLENVNYLTLQGAHDADMSTFHGIRQWARVKFTDGGYHAKAAVYTYRANHGQFNTVWGNTDFGFPMSRYLNRKALLSGDAPALDGFLLPGHVSTMIGSRVYEPIARDFGVACVIAGFEPLDILQSILMLVKQVQDDRAEVENQYRRVVTPDGNDAARRAVAEIFEQCDAAWRGIGVIPKSGLTIRSGYSEYDARVRFGLPETTDFREPDGCQCGAILKGQCQPPDCPLFGTVCTPAQPVGPCMVSSEGTCAAWHKYGAS
jgi:hypothetical protein